MYVYKLERDQSSNKGGSPTTYPVCMIDTSIIIEG